jgi:hypothetical protein
MSVTEETLNTIHSRLQELSSEATPEQYLGGAPDRQLQIAPPHRCVISI